MVLVARFIVPVKYFPKLLKEVKRLTRLVLTDAKIKIPGEHKVSALLSLLVLMINGVFVPGIPVMLFTEVAKLLTY